jgi:hypothetical protein
MNDGRDDEGTRRSASTAVADERAAGFRVPDEGALPVATFADAGYEKPKELPSERWRRRGKRTVGTVLAAAIASLGGLGLVGFTPGYEGVGVMAVLCAPIIIGAIVSLFPVEKPPAGAKRTGSVLANKVVDKRLAHLDRRRARASRWSSCSWCRSCRAPSISSWSSTRTPAPP